MVRPAATALAAAALALLTAGAAGADDTGQIVVDCVDQRAERCVRRRVGEHEAARRRPKRRSYHRATAFDNPKAVLDVKGRVLVERRGEPENQVVTGFVRREQRARSFEELRWMLDKACSHPVILCRCQRVSI